MTGDNPSAPARPLLEGDRGVGPETAPHLTRLDYIVSPLPVRYPPRVHCWWKADVPIGHQAAAVGGVVAVVLVANKPPL